MSQGNLRLAATGLGLLAWVVLGYAVGRFSSRSGCCGIVAFSWLTGIVLSLAAIFRWPAYYVHSWKTEQFVGLGVLVYFYMTTIVEPFAGVHDTFTLRICLAWLSPLVLGGVVLLRRGDSLAWGACCAMLFASDVALSYTATHGLTGVGFLYSWIA